MTHRQGHLRSRLLCSATVVAACLGATGADDAPQPEWKPAFADAAETAWTESWFLDGAKSSVTRTDAGLVLKSGEVTKDNTGHAVLWTKASFSGDVRVEYDFTRLDSATDHVSVCILYLQATGTGKPPFVEDIHAWSDLRKTPKMSLYFQNMNTYHVSYACTGGDDFNYVRARRYPAKGAFDKDTRIEPSYENVDLFKPGETWHLVFEKTGTDLTFTATRQEERHVWKWNAKQFAPITQGRIGLRQMHGRESRYENFRVFTRQRDG